MSSASSQPGPGQAATVVVNDTAQSAILAVTYGHPQNQLAGTCFHVHREDGKSYVLTALHVLDDLDRLGAVPHIEGRPVLARLSPPKGYYANDMAMLAIEALPNVSILPLSGELSRDQRVTLWGYAPDPANDPTAPPVYRLHSIPGQVRGGVGFLGQMAGAGSQGLGINIHTDSTIPNGFSGGPVFDENLGVLGLVTTRQTNSEGDAVRTLGVAQLLDHAPAEQLATWRRVVDAISATLKIPVIKEFAHPTHERYRQPFNVYFAVIFVLASISIVMAYWNAPFAWRLQFGRPYGWNTPEIGSLIEIAFTALFLVVARAMIVGYFGEGLTRLIDMAKDPVAWVCAAGGVLFASTLYGLWNYHTLTGPEKLVVWAEKAKATTTETAVRTALESELAKDPAPGYRKVYYKYFPYSTINFALIAVPLCIVLGVAAAQDLAELVKHGKAIRRDLEKAEEYQDPREQFYLYRVITGPFQEYRAYCEQVIRRSLSAFALFAILICFHLLTCNLAESAFPYTILGAITVFLGPICCVAAVIAGYQRHVTSVEQSIRDSKTMGQDDKKAKVQQFKSEYTNAIWNALTSDRFVLVGAALYAVSLILLIIRYRLNSTP